MILKKSFLCIIALLFISSSLFSEQTAYCRIVIYRNNPSSEDDTAYKILSNETLLTDLHNRNYFAFYMPEGILNLKAYYRVSADLEVSIVRNMTCFIRLDVSTVEDKQIAKMVVVDSITASNEMLSCKIPNAHKPISNRTIPQNKIGISLAPGWGFDRIPIITTTYSSEATIGFGGGFNGLISYTREISSFFGMDFDLSTQSSSIKPYLSNASVDFSRDCLSINPFFIIPVKDGGRKRIKIGAGVDYYFGSVLNFDMSKLKGGFNEKWNYNNALGYNVTGMYEDIFRNNWTGQVGLKLCSVNYRFESTQGNYAPTDNTFGNPNGLSLYFLVGLGYHF